MIGKKKGDRKKNTDFIAIAKSLTTKHA